MRVWSGLDILDIGPHREAGPRAHSSEVAMYSYSVFVSRYVEVGKKHQ